MLDIRNENSDGANRISGFVSGNSVDTEMENMINIPEENLVNLNKYSIGAIVKAIYPSFLSMYNKSMYHKERDVLIATVRLFLR